MVIGERVGDVSMRLRAQQRLGIALIESGDFAGGRALEEDTLEAARAAGLPRIESLCLNVLSIIAGMQDDPMRSLEIDHQKLVLDDMLGNPLNYATTVANHGESWLQLGEHTQALHYLEEGLRLTRMVGNRAMQCIVLLNLSQLTLRMGDAPTALAHAQAALGIARAVQSPEYEARAEWAQGHAELALRQLDAAASAFERTRVLAAEADLIASRLDAAAGTASVALARGDVAAALQAIPLLLEHLAGGGTFDATDGPRHSWLACCKVLAQAGDPRADAMLNALHADLQQHAAAITEGAWRDGYLQHIPEHREIVEMWSARQGAGA